ncbi:MAG: AAA family ATPase, partial [Chloroflexia bacterium]|nr:AAA family ATPase [Chloroflexia bacterium]
MPEPMPADRTFPQSLSPVLVLDRDRPTASLPVPLTSFVGREREILAVADLLRREGVRLVTLIGPGGVGKTRLALRAAEAVGGDLVDAVRFVDLSPLADPSLVLPAIAQALGLPTAGNQSVARQLAAWLAP